MAVSSRCAVAIHALTKLAAVGERTLTSAQIADSLASNAVLVRRILGQLRDAGLVLSTEGRNGGWTLARPARRITLLDVYRAVEDGPVLARHPHAPSELCEVGRHMQGIVDDAFREAEDALAARLGRTTIGQLHREVVERERSMSAR